jgi:hypothetical protein
MNTAAAVSNSTCRRRLVDVGSIGPSELSVAAG